MKKEDLHVNIVPATSPIKMNVILKSMGLVACFACWAIALPSSPQQPQPQLLPQKLRRYLQLHDHKNQYTASKLKRSELKRSLLSQAMTVEEAASRGLLRLDENHHHTPHTLLSPPPPPKNEPTSLLSQQEQQQQSQHHYQQQQQLRQLHQSSESWSIIQQQLKQHDHDHNIRHLQNGGDGYSTAWISGYSLKFQACHHISQWNDAVDIEDDVRISTKRLVRFRMCPSESCNRNNNNGGCSEAYGDYIVDLNAYLYYYFSAKQTYQQFECDYLTNYVCDCEDEQDNEEFCMWDCYSDHNMASICMQDNPYNNNNNNNRASDNDNGLALLNYMNCVDSGVTDASGHSLYIGPFCASMGGVIHLGVFMDGSCTNFADATDDGREAFFNATGLYLPYTEANIVDLGCMSCMEPTNNNLAGNDMDDSDVVNEMCEQIYTLAGKCEASLPYGTTSSPNNNACNYLEGIKRVRQDGTISTAQNRANKTAAAFIGVFTGGFMLLSGYVYFLKTKLDRSRINLNAEE